MMIVSINAVNFGSTGKIMVGIASVARNHGYHYFTFSATGKSMRKDISHHRFIGSRVGHNLHARIGAPFGIQLSAIDTIAFLRVLDEVKPDLVHLHNLHGDYINLPLLFRYIKRRNIPVVWTLHDCWAFTGRCPYFDMAHCDRWKTGCYDCPYPKRDYPAAYLDRTREMWALKKKWFTGVRNMTIVTPSRWLADLVKQSFLKDYPVKVIYNGIDLSVFRPTPSDFREKHGIKPETKMLLGVAFGWGRRKGLDVFCDLAKRLDDSYQIVLVGTDDSVDQQLPSNVISIHRTENQRELAKIYTAADVFVNPTREDNFPTTNLEALACGTPVITFNTGGSPEAIDETCGSVVPQDDVEALEEEIRRVCLNKPYTREACLKRALAFDMHERFEEYVRLYEGIVHE